MARLVSIDPGNNTGIAVWEDRELVGAYLTEYWDPSVHCLESTTVVEVPKIYPTGKGKGDPNDLIKVAFVAGRISASSPQVIKVSPYQWKGQVDPDIMIERIKEFLLPKELALVPRLSQSLIHNVWDAIGIGLHHLGRMGVGGR